MVRIGSKVHGATIKMNTFCVYLLSVKRSCAIPIKVVFESDIMKCPIHSDCLKSRSTATFYFLTWFNHRSYLERSEPRGFGGLLP